MKKKFLVLGLIAALILSSVTVFNGCDSRNVHTRDIWIYVPAGLPAIAAAHMFYNETQIEYDGGTRNTRYMVTTGEGLHGVISGRHADFALAPINLVAANFNAFGDYILAGVALMGAMRIVQRTAGGFELIDSLEQLRGQRIVAFQQNASPGIILESILEKAGLEVNIISTTQSVVQNAVNITYLNSPLDVQAALTQGAMFGGTGNEQRFGLLAEPVATALTSTPAFDLAFNLSEIWFDMFDFNLPQVALMVRSDLARANPSLVSRVIDMFDYSINFALENAGEVARMVGADYLNITGIPSAPVITSFIDSASGVQVLNFRNAIEAQSDVQAFFEIIHGVNPTYIGGRLPTKEFFFGA